MPSPAADMDSALRRGVPFDDEQDRGDGHIGDGLGDRRDDGVIGDGNGVGACIAAAGHVAAGLRFGDELLEDLLADYVYGKIKDEMNQDGAAA